jgi:hypothetical protein
MGKIREEPAAAAPVPLARLACLSRGAPATRTAGWGIAPPRSTSAGTSTVPSFVAAPLAVKKGEQAVAEARIAIAACRSPLGHCCAGDTAPAVVGSESASRCVKRYQRTIGLPAASGSPMPRLFPRRGDRRRREPRWLLGRRARERHERARAKGAEQAPTPAERQRRGEHAAVGSLGREAR